MFKYGHKWYCWERTSLQSLYLQVSFWSEWYQNCIFQSLSWILKSHWIMTWALSVQLWEKNWAIHLSFAQMAIAELLILTSILDRGFFFFFSLSLSEARKKWLEHSLTSSYSINSILLGLHFCNLDYNWFNQKRNELKFVHLFTRMCPVIQVLGKNSCINLGLGYWLCPVFPEWS